MITIANFIGFLAHWETDHTETNMNNIIGAAVFDGTIDDEFEEGIEYGLRPEDVSVNAQIVRAAAQMWRNNGGQIPEWTEPTNAEIAAGTPLYPVQFHAMMEIAGYTQAIESAINTLPSQDAAVARAKLNYAKMFRIDDPTMQQIRVAIGLSQSDLEGLWVAAIAI
jgi:hypothetical protein